MNIIQKNIPNLIYGGMDGIISTFAIIIGTLGAKQNMGIAFILAVANLIADAFSMAVGSYESVIEEEYKFQAVSKSIVTFIGFVLIGGIPILCFIGALGKKKNLEFSASNIRLLIGLTLVAFIVIGLIKANYEKIVGKAGDAGDAKNSKTNLKKLKIVVTTVLRGCVAGLIAYLVAHHLTQHLEG